MERKQETWIIPSASKCVECVNQAIHIFDDILEDKGSPEAFYRARSYLREGKSFWEKALKEAKKLLGPLPDYVKDDYRNWRKEITDKQNLLADSQDYKMLLKELQQDEYLKLVMPEENIQSHLEEHYEQQQQGQRKLAHIKIRILLDEIYDRLNQAKQKEKEIIRRRMSA